MFYQIYPDNLGLYVELGLTLLKFGEEARVPPATFSLDGKSRKGHAPQRQPAGAGRLSIRTGGHRRRAGVAT